MPTTDFETLLAQLKYNVSRTTLPDDAAITQIRKEVLNFGLSIAILNISNSWGAAYLVYPGWNTTDLQSWWRLQSHEVVTGASGVRDSHGSLDGTINGNPVEDNYDFITSVAKASVLQTRDRNVEFLTFDGSGDYINLGDITAFDGAATFTIGFRFRPDTLTDQYALIARWPSADGDKQFLIEMNTTNSPGGIEVTFATDGVGGTASIYITTPNLVADTWYNVIIEYVGGTPVAFIYIDGTVVSVTTSGTIPSTLQTVADDVLIGRREDDTAKDFAGDMYDVAWWNTQLSGPDITLWEEDDIDDRIVIGFSRIPGTESVSLPPGHLTTNPAPGGPGSRMYPDRTRRKRRIQQSISNQITTWA